MKRLICLLSGLALLITLTLMSGPADAQGGKAPSVKEIMGRLHKGADSPLTRIRAELQDEQPDWALVQRGAMDFVTLGAALGKNAPPKGDKKSWTELSAKYLEQVKALDAAAQKKDKNAALAAHTRLNESCKDCHTAHRPN